MPGHYFITVCTKNRECILGKIKNGEMEINKYGRIVLDCWNDMPGHYKKLKLDEFIIMPNHVHGIMIIVSENECLSDSAMVGKCIVETGFKPVSNGGNSMISGRSNNVEMVDDVIGTGLKPVSTMHT